MDNCTFYLLFRILKVFIYVIYRRSVYAKEITVNQSRNLHSYDMRESKRMKGPTYWPDQDHPPNSQDPGRPDLSD